MINGWRREQMIGQGAFAKVYRLRDLRGNRILACKVAETEDGIKLLEREAEVLKAAEHPLFARYVDFVRERDSAMLLMEYVEGEDLAALLERGGALPPEQAVRIAAELAESLMYLHERPCPMLYRDLKPENIRIQPDGRARLLDLGCVCSVDEAGYSRAGSRGYAAPEQLREDGDGRKKMVQGAYSDVYTLGRLLHYMLTGQNPCLPPFRKHPIRAYDPTLSPLLEQLIEQCTAEEPADRLPDMRNVLRQLAPFMEKKPSLALRVREWRALAGWRLSGRKWESEFLYEKCVYKNGGGAPC